MKNIIKAFLILFIIISVIAPSMGNVTEVDAAIGVPTPAANDGCLPDTNDPDCDPNCVVDGSAGLIPCGRNCDDRDTTYTNESDDCTLCHGMLMGQLIIEFMVKIAGIAAMIAIAIGGFLYMFAIGNQGTLDMAKSMIKNVLIGFILVFVAWILVDTILTTFGYIDPLDGTIGWSIMNC